MTKESYFEMCDMLNQPVVESEIPIEFDDFALEVQQAFGVYRMLRDEWDTMNGNYLGKSLIGIKDLLEAAEIELQDQKFVTMLVRLIDEVRSSEINKQKTQEPAK
jgi:hypothetical protein